MTWNSEAWIKACIKAIRKSDMPVVVHVFDNASTDKTWHIVDQFYDVKKTYSRKNIGFGAAHNRLMAKCTTPFYLCLNPDTVVTSDFISQLVHALKHAKNACMAGGILLRPSGKVDSMGIALKPGLRGYDMTTNESARIGFSGAAVLFHRDKIQHLGGFDPAFFAYKEDIDLCLRALKKGYQPVFLPGAKATHMREVQPGKWLREVKTFRRRLSFWGQWILLKRHGNILGWGLWCAQALLRIVLDPISILYKFPRKQS